MAYPAYPRARILDSLRRQWEKPAMVMILFTMATAIAVLAFWALSIEHWRHDSAIYATEQHSLALVKSEGRWVNYLLYPLVRKVDPHVAWLMNIIIITSALFLIFRRLLQDPLVAINLALILSVFPALLAQNMWPSDILPASFIFLISVLTIQKIGWYALPVFGILLFGSIPYLYYILPLMVMPLTECCGARDALRFLLPGVVWGASLLLGYFVAAASNILLVGKFGIEFSAWRKPNPVEDLTTLIDNIEGYAHVFSAHVSYWLPTWAMGLLVAALVGCLAAGYFSSRRVTTLTLRLGYAIVVLISPYLTVVLAGIVVQYRSLLPMAVGVVALPFILTNRSVHRLLVVVVFVAIGFPSFILSASGVEWFAKISQINVANIGRIMPRSPSSYEGVVVDGRNYPQYFGGVRRQIKELPRKPSFIATLYDPYRLAPAFKEAGFKKILLCPHHDLNKNIPSRCARFGIEGVPEDVCSNELRQMCIVGIRRNWIIIRLMP